MSCLLCWSVAALFVLALGAGAQQTVPDEHKLNTDSVIRELTNTSAPGDIWQAAKNGILSDVIFFVNQDPTSVNKSNKNENNYTPLYYASKLGHFDVVHFLVLHGANVDGVNVFDGTPLMTASGFGHTSIMEYLIAHGADVNRHSLNRRTPLHWAVLGNSLAAVKLLIINGADKNVKDKAGRTPLEDAMFRNRTAIVKFLSSN